MNGGGAERVGDPESETGSRHGANSPKPDAGVKITDHELETRLKSDAKPTAPPRRPSSSEFLMSDVFFSVLRFPFGFVFIVSLFSLSLSIHFESTNPYLFDHSNIFI